jgi:penicillin-binding protein 1B
VWVGNDDYTDLKIEGAHAAVPIWAEFMKRAVELPQYSDTRAFTPPAGVVEVRIDKVTNLLSDATCPEGYNAAFLDGTAPTDTCDHSNGDQRNLFQKLFGLGDKTSEGVVPPGTPTPAQSSSDPALADPATAASNDSNGQAPKKKGFFGKVFGVFKGDDKSKPAPPPKSQP